MKNWLIIILCLIATPGMAGVYKWVDENGKVVYSQKPPPAKDYEKIKVQRGPTSPPLYGSQTGDTAEEQPEGKNRPEKANGGNGNNVADNEAQKNAQAREAKCANAKKQLEIYQVYRRVKDKDGNVKRIDEKERAQNIKEAQEAIRDFCN